jgi:hypothetical protein
MAFCGLMFRKTRLKPVRESTLSKVLVTVYGKGRGMSRIIFKVCVTLETLRGLALLITRRGRAAANCRGTACRATTGMRNAD